MSDDARTPSAGLVPDPEGTEDLHRLEDETPDAFGEPMDADTFENELPEEGVSPEDVAFEADLERDLEQDAVPEEGLDLGDDAVPGEVGAAREDARYDLEQEMEDEEVRRYGEG